MENLWVEKHPLGIHLNGTKYFSLVFDAEKEVDTITKTKAIVLYLKKVTSKYVKIDSSRLLIFFYKTLFLNNNWFLKIRKFTHNYEI